MKGDELELKKTTKDELQENILLKSECIYNLVSSNKKSFQNEFNLNDSINPLLMSSNTANIKGKLVALEVNI